MREGERESERRREREDLGRGDATMNTKILNSDPVERERERMRQVVTGNRVIGIIRPSSFPLSLSFSPRETTSQLYEKVSGSRGETVFIYTTWNKRENEKRTTVTETGTRMEKKKQDNGMNLGERENEPRRERE